MDHHRTVREDVVHRVRPGLQQFREGSKAVVQRAVGPHHSRVDFIAELNHGRRRAAGLQDFQGATHMARHGFFDFLEGQAFPSARQGLVAWICPRVAEVKIEHDVHAQIVPLLRFVHNFQPRTVQSLMRVVPNPQPHHIHALVAHPCAWIFNRNPILRAVHDAVVNHLRKKRGIDASPGLGTQ